MSNILISIEVSASGAVQGTAAELIAAASKLGTAIAVVAAVPGTAPALAARLGELGASEVFIGETADAGSVASAPQVAALAAAVQRYSPTAVLASQTADGREVAVTVPGQMALQRMPRATKSAATALVSPMTAALVAP